MFYERINEMAPLVCKRHAAIGGVGPDDVRLKFLLEVQAKLSPSLMFSTAAIPDLIRDLAITDEHFIYILDVYSELSFAVFPNKEAFEALVEEYAYSFGSCGNKAVENTALRKYTTLGKTVPTSTDVKNVLTENPWLIALHAMTTWVFPVEVKRPRGQ